MSTEEAPVPSRFAAPGGQGGPSAGMQVTVASGVGMPDGRTVDCPAAPLLTGSLRRANVPVSRAVLVPVTGSHGRGTDLEGWSAPVNGPDHAPRALLAAAAPPRHRELRGVVRTVVSRWAAVRGSREVLLAEPRSFCAGVERAIEVVERALESMGAPVYVRKQVVHNTHVVHELGERGAVFVDELDEVPEGATVVFSAHGVSPAVRTQAAQRGLDVIDATCPLVTKVHVEARRFAERGDTVVFIGHAGHEETEGTLGEAPDRMVLVENREDIARLEVPDPGRVSFLTQTTLAVDETEDLIAALRDRFPALRGPKSDDICYATTNRQDALRAVAGDADVVLVLGSANSSNSVRLVELAHRHGTPAHLVEDVTGIHPDWLAGTRTVGVTAGASAPPRLVDEVVTALGGLGPVTVDRRHVATETVEFSLPRKVRP